ncbi:FAD-dependent oxidoreductase [Sphingomonas sp. G-3-2-10]|uniref:FAD-dependent oxidoreductase n=1 Tax=Sphingomonas sp. G-3-2-10 TaxID=2728838 RepID=UPI00146F7BB8|nr:FAD-dependent oxidoreductase [Sphingomonas sp. G-3-2-10]NML08455.1 FAD-dependent oxidoreductase [Sphingomonas sp. G-3-2-10]
MANVANIPVWREIGATPHPGSASETAPVVIVGAGPIGLAMALDLGRRGHPVVVLSQLDFVAAGSKAICFAKRSLDIFDRLGVGDAIVGKGVIWNVGKVFWGSGEEPVFQFDMLPVKNQKRPGFINIQQYHVEDRLIDALAALPNVELRWGHRMAGIEARDDGARVAVDTEAGGYAIDADWVIACDGSKSAVRDALGLDFDGRVFEDNFLIADVKMRGERPSERWFWFDPPFNPGQSALMHKQPDNVWRLDFQLGWDIDRAAAVKPENVDPLVRAMLGDNVEYEQEWYSVYTFQCRRMARFVHGRVVFAGDSAHLVSPFGARGCNGGLADVDNLGWKLDLILRGDAGEGLLESYDAEAITIADENILNSSRSTDFMTPKSAASRIYRDAVLELASEVPFARPFVNSGRLSTAVALPDSALNTPDRDAWNSAGIAPGLPALDARLGESWLLERLGSGFTLLADGWTGEVEGLTVIAPGAADTVLRERYAMAPGTAYLIRPDHYVCARWRNCDAAAVRDALARAKGN